MHELAAKLFIWIPYGSSWPRFIGFRTHRQRRYRLLGGKLEAGETNVQALIRELKEEIHLEVDASKLYYQLLLEQKFKTQEFKTAVYTIDFDMQGRILKLLGDKGHKILKEGTIALVREEDFTPVSQEQLEAMVSLIDVQAHQSYTEYVNKLRRFGPIYKERVERVGRFKLD